MSFVGKDKSGTVKNTLFSSMNPTIYFISEK